MDNQESTGTSPYKSRPGLKRLLRASTYSAQGIRAAWKHEASFRQEVIVCAVLSVASFWLAPSLVFWVLMNASLLLVLCVETINSAIEALADAISTETHPLIGRAKDLGSAAVLFSLLVGLLIWGAAIFTRLAMSMNL
jgi:diacylglycerol kinase (ATP)